ncbi:MAG: LapA family protein [Candidatus Eisenbacteria sp.]|nr:LapA family protein [Candidatus Eisenbacteria bacterium]
MKPKLILLVASLVLALTVLFQNTHITTFRLLFWHPEMSLAILVLIILAIGFVLGFVIAKLTAKRKT